MTPLEFMNQYRSMNVRLDGDQTGIVDVHAYLINVDSSKHNPKAAKAMWAQISQKMADEVKTANAAAAHTGPHGHPAAPATQPAKHATRAGLITAIDPTMTDALLAAVPLGKGSPSALKDYLRLAARYGFSTQQDLGAFVSEANRYVGLDCSGFVSNYLVATRNLTASSVVNTSARSYDVAARRRQSIEAVKAFDVMVWSDGGHVAILNADPVPRQVAAPIVVHHPHPHTAHGHALTQPTASAAPKTVTEYSAVVVESNGGRGLGSEPYTLVSVDHHGLFTVKRQTEHHKTHHVHIIDWRLVG